MTSYWQEIKIIFTCLLKDNFHLGLKTLRLLLLFDICVCYCLNLCEFQSITLLLPSMQIRSKSVDKSFISK